MTASAQRTEQGDAGNLAELETRMLEFERAWWRRGAVKEDAIRQEFGWSTTRYYQALNRLIDDPAALSVDPVLVRRLHRVRAARQEARTSLRRRS